MARLKTGTPPRLDGRTIDWASVEWQPGDEAPSFLSAMTTRAVAPQLSCAITRTTEATHRVIRESLDRSPLYTGMIGARGPRSEEHTSELQSLMRISYAVFCLKKKKQANK